MRQNFPQRPSPPTIPLNKPRVPLPSPRHKPSHNRPAPPGPGQGPPGRCRRGPEALGPLRHPAEKRRPPLPPGPAMPPRAGRAAPYWAVGSGRSRCGSEPAALPLRRWLTWSPARPGHIARTAAAAGHASRQRERGGAAARGKAARGGAAPVTSRPRGQGFFPRRGGSGSLGIPENTGK